ncbi:ATP-binding cassette domain-containing protein [Candidatus Saccharibacteria bacterium]|nr:ATP-binding cassette domain-containing protein [Candidatus Saccharibacteria bacterium]
MTDFVEIKDFRISFAGKTVIKKLSFSVKKGEIFGLLGSNGSGKTTTIRTLLGIYKADRGQLLINGKPFDQNSDIKVGYLPEERGLYKKENVIDTMVYFGRLRGLKDPKGWSMKYLKRVDMADYAKTKVEKLSQGMQQKIQIGITIMGDPDLLILDEPTKGFDPVNRRLLMDIIEELHTKGSTIILITHYMDEVERFCDRILLLKDGVARAYGTINEVRNKFHRRSIDQIFIDVYGAKEETA